MTLIPAYGRDYKSKEAVLADFDAGKDFIIADMHSRYNGRPTNKEDFGKGDSVTIRYNQLRNVLVFKVGE